MLVKMTKAHKVQDVPEARVEHWEKNGWTVAVEGNKKDTVKQQPAVEEDHDDLDSKVVGDDNYDEEGE